MFDRKCRIYEPAIDYRQNKNKYNRVHGDAVVFKFSIKTTSKGAF